MPRGVLVQRFGPFELDLAGGRLFRGDEQVRMSQAQAAVLVHLVEHAGEVVSKDTLMHVGWPHTAVTENNLDQAISRLRRKFNGAGQATEYIKTIPHRGYRFAVVATTGYRAVREGILDEHLAPYRTLAHGRHELDFLDRDRVHRAKADIELVVQQAPECAVADIDLAMACALLVEASAADPAADLATLHAGVARARAACARLPASADAWATLALLLGQQGHHDAARGAATKAMELDPEDWRHALRAAYVSWGGERLHLARHVLTLYPGFALAHWLRTTVFIARGIHDIALAEAERGCAAQDAQTPGSPFPGVGMHLHRGHLLAARGRLEEAVAAFERELAHVARSTQIYAREAEGNAWYALGAVRRRQRQHDGAAAAFTRALAVAGGHVATAAALHGTIPPSAALMDVALAQAIVFARAGQHADAARVYLTALRGEPQGSAGWMLSVEPTLNVGAHPDVWTEALALVRSRAG